MLHGRGVKGQTGALLLGGRTCRDHANQPSLFPLSIPQRSPQTSMSASHGISNNHSPT